MTVHFIGAGPGAPDLLTLRGRDLIAASPVCLYAGSLVPTALLDHCPPGARIVNTASMALDDIIAAIQAAHAAGQDVARLHSGDLSVWSAMGEQLRRLRALDIPFTVTPGVPAFAAAAAALEAELTLPTIAQSVILTRTPGRGRTPGADSRGAIRYDRPLSGIGVSPGMSWFEKIMPSRIKTERRTRSVPEGLWIKCSACDAVLYRAELERNLNVCPKCSHHMRIGGRERLARFLDEGNQEEIGAEISPEDRRDHSGHEPDLHLRITEPRRPRRDDEIASRREPAPARESSSVNGGDHGNANISDQLEQIRKAPRVREVFLVRAFADLLHRF